MKLLYSIFTLCCIVECTYCLVSRTHLTLLYTCVLHHSPGETPFSTSIEEAQLKTHVTCLDFCSFRKTIPAFSKHRAVRSNRSGMLCNKDSDKWPNAELTVQNNVFLCCVRERKYAADTHSLHCNSPTDPEHSSPFSQASVERTTTAEVHESSQQLHSYHSKALQLPFHYQEHTSPSAQTTLLLSHITNIPYWVSFIKI